MFIGWLKFKDVAGLVEIANDIGWLADGYHIKLMMMHSSHLSYGAYDGDKLIGAVMAIGFEDTAQIKYFMVKKEYQKQGIGKRLFSTIFEVLKRDYRKIYIHINPSLISFFEGFGFQKEIEVGRFINVGKVPPFNFTNANAKELDSGNFDTIIKNIDYETFNENRLNFLFDEMERHSSLKFALPNSFQHSSVVNARNVYLGPWQVKKGHQEEALKMIKGVLYFRGLKKVVADIPLGIEEISSLYKEFHFEQKDKFIHMSYGGNSIKFENIYAFSL